LPQDEGYTSPKSEIKLPIDESSCFMIRVMSGHAQKPFGVSVLVFIKDDQDRFLMLKRTRAPNFNCWTPLGGKVEIDEGESPHDCAVREVFEEAGMTIGTNDLHLFGMISEKNYEGEKHWLMFLFECKKTIDFHPEVMEEGHFDFFSRAEIDDLPDEELPETDRQGLWASYDKYHTRFVALKADCDPKKKLEIIVEESF